MRITKTDRAALLKCRYAGRYDDLTARSAFATPPEEAAEEQAASSVRVEHKTWHKLRTLGLVEFRGGMRLTDAGRAALAKP
jgi:hypothetical protein